MRTFKIEVPLPVGVMLEHAATKKNTTPESLIQELVMSYARSKEMVRLVGFRLPQIQAQSGAKNKGE